jgi:hypothetical protein
MNYRWKVAVRSAHLVTDGLEAYEFHLIARLLDVPASFTITNII